MKKLIKNKNYRLIFLGNVISILGDKLQDVVFMWYIYTLTNSTILASISLIVNFIPKIIFSPLAGLVSDNYNRKHIIVICDMFNAVLAILLGLMIYFKFQVVTLFIITFLMNVVDTFYLPVGMSIIPQIVEKEDIISANSINSVFNNGISIVAPVLAGILYVLISPVFIFIGSGILFIIAVSFEIFIKYDHDIEKNTKKEKVKINIRIINLFKKYIDGFRIIIDNKFLLFNAIIGGGIINFFLAPISIYIPVYVHDYLNYSSTYFGIMSSAVTVGSLISAVFLIGLGKKFNKYLLVSLGFIFQGISLLLFGSLNNFIGGIISLIILGIALGITGIYINTIVQEEIPNEILGRCISVIMIISNISVPMGYLIGGYVINFIKLNLILIFSGFIILVCGIISFFILKKISVEKNIPA
ncbi:MFS transporter [Clostridium butanoliproducens]|uniref:MFS transporter n=1 Tax=Clostridium butanoliproducens TaxID=2991837 RepID=UPI0024B9DD2E|nr:MFS transporter [Clostridium butanoliproducens]MDU1348663.1 MFS transporter [Clostridium argentinense]